MLFVDFSSEFNTISPWNWTHKETPDSLCAQPLPVQAVHPRPQSLTRDDTTIVSWITNMRLSGGKTHPCFHQWSWGGAGEQVQVPGEYQRTCHGHLTSPPWFRNLRNSWISLKKLKRAKFSSFHRGEQKAPWLDTSQTGPGQQGHETHRQVKVLKVSK